MNFTKKEAQPFQATTIKQRFDALGSICHDSLILVDRAGIINDLNTAAENLFAENRDRLQGADISTLFTDSKKTRAAISELFEKGRINRISLLTLNCHANVELSGSVYHLNEDDRAEAILSLREAGDRRKNNEQTDHLAAIVTYSNDAIISTDPGGTIKTWNKSAERILGYSAEEAIGKPLAIITFPGQLSEEKEISEKIKKGDAVSQYETTRRRKDGKEIHVLVSASPIKDERGTVQGISKVIREITERRQFEKELIEAKRNAERDKKIAEEAVETKQQFLSNMSHEIRTPLNAIIGFTKVVLKTNLDEKQKEYLDAIKVSGEALIVLINDILDLAKVEAGKMSFEKIPFRPAESISSMLHLFETKLVQKHIELVKNYDEHIPEILEGDPVRLHQVILNLVSNAIKFTQKGQVSVSAKLREEDAEKAIIEFSVKDTGIGIADDKLDTIFDNFQQASNGTSRVYGGTGLGLAIVKQLVLSQGGSLQVKSKVDEGSEFTFSLPFKKTKEKVAIKKEAESPVEEVSDSVRVLVAEDVLLNQLLVKTLLKEFGFEATIASNGKEAVEWLRRQRFDLVLMDLQMPEMNGYEATDYIRNELKSDIPIIALTADVTTADVDKCRNMGMNDYVSKPIDDKLLYNKILKYINKPIASDKGKAKSPIMTVPVTEKVTNLDYLRQHTKGNPEIMKQMIKIYLDETPTLVNTMKQSVDNMDWDSLTKAAHSIIPTFAVVGINDEYTEMAKKIKEHAARQEEAPLINTLLVKIDDICSKAVNELEGELEAL